MCSYVQVPPKSAELPRSDCAALLTHRTVVRVQGDDAGQLLQGLVTADVLSEAPSLYSMMLNPQVKREVGGVYCVGTGSTASGSLPSGYV